MRVKDLASSMPMVAAASAAKRASMETIFPIWPSTVVLSSSMWTTDWLQNTGLEQKKTSYLISLLRCPNNVLDFYEVVKYVVSHASELGVDPSRIAIAGESGGGYVCAGTMHYGLSPVEKWK